MIRQKSLRVGSSHQVVIEVGRGQKTARQAEQTLNRTGSDYALVICDDTLQHEADKKVIYLPKDFFWLA